MSEFRNYTERPQRPGYPEVSQSLKQLGFSEDSYGNGYASFSRGSTTVKISWNTAPGQGLGLQIFSPAVQCAYVYFHTVEDLLAYVHCPSSTVNKFNQDVHRRTDGFRARLKAAS